MTLAIGVGCRRGCSADAIVSLIQASIAERDCTRACLYSIEAKRDEVGLHGAAARLGLPLKFLSVDALAAVLPSVTIRSSRVAAAVDVPSVAEAAALAGAGSGAYLVVPRKAEGGATCAIAVSGSRP